MTAAILHRYGPPDVVTLAKLPAPVPRPGEALVRVTAAAVTLGDARIRAARVPAGMSLMLRLAFGLTGPRRPVLGMNFAGVLRTAAAGLAPGARVMGVTGMRLGAHAEQVALPADRLLPIPQGMTDAEAAAFFFGGLTAADFLIDKAGLQPGQRLLVNGATGEVGCAALQIAHHLGAQVTAVARAENHAFARDLGADACHDYRSGPPVGTWDAILDVKGTLPMAQAKGLLAPGGVLMPVTATLAQMLGAALRPRRGGRRITGTLSAEGPQAMRRLLDLHEKGAFRPIVGATFPFANIRDAHALADSGHKRGTAVVLMDQATDTAMAAK
jgi:NADPH:quinone reductase-like Zn-dependent oxidoreductase